MGIKREIAKPLLNDIALAVWRLLPANPIVLRVVQGGSKRTQHLWVRVVYLLILFGVMLVAQFANSSSGQSLTLLAKSSTRIFEIIAVLQLAMMCFLAPVFTAGAISQEKDAETFNVLLTTPLTNAQIVLGSLASRLFFVLALLVAGLPIFCITMIFGGVTSEQIFLSFGIAGCTAILTGSLAILVSVLRVGSRGTIFSFYVGIAVYLFAGLGLGNMQWTCVPESVIPGVNTGMTWLAVIHPYYALEVALNHIRPPDAAAVAHRAWPFNHMLASPPWAYMTLTLLVSAVLVGFATIFLRSGIKQGEAGLLLRLQRRFGRQKVGEERRHRIRRVWSNPIAWREAVTKASAASSGFIRYSYLIGGVTAGALFLYAYGSGWFSTTPAASPALARAWLIWIVMVEFLVVLLMAANTAGTAITRERDDGTMELLLTTPLTSRYIVWGKLRGLISFAVPLMAVPALTVLAAAAYDAVRAVPEPVVSLLSAILLPILLTVYASFACMIGLQMSLKSRKSVQAVMASMGILLVVAFGLSLCAFGTSTVPPEIASVTVPLTFVTAVYYVLDPASLGRGGVAGPSNPFDLQVLLCVGTLIAAALYGAIVAGTYRSMVNNFDMIVRKQQR